MTLVVLIVDDESDVELLFRQQFRRELRDGQWSMEFALTAEAALEKTRAASGRLILLVSDINMPGMSGLDLIPRAKALRPDLPIVMVTAYGDPQTRSAALARGADGFYTKPIDFAALRAEIAARAGAR